MYFHHVFMTVFVPSVPRSKAKVHEKCRLHTNLRRKTKIKPNEYSNFYVDKSVSMFCLAFHRYFDYTIRITHALLVIPRMFRFPDSIRSIETALVIKTESRREKNRKIKQKNKPKKNELMNSYKVPIRNYALMFAQFYYIPLVFRRRCCMLIIILLFIAYSCFLVSSPLLFVKK